MVWRLCVGIRCIIKFCRGLWMGICNSFLERILVSNLKRIYSYENDAVRGTHRRSLSGNRGIKSSRDWVKVLA